MPDNLVSSYFAKSIKKKKKVRLGVITKPPEILRKANGYLTFHLNWKKSFTRKTWMIKLPVTTCLRESDFSFT